MPPTVCLNMIVKNEAKVIRRCLDSVRPFIHRWVIVDTGSTDGTQAIIREHFSGVPGELHERPWKNFGHNRSEALALALGKTDYILVIDADEELIATPGFVMPSGADTYMVLYSFADSPVTWHRATFIKASLPWRYEGVLHEYLECGHPPERAILQGLRITSYTDGARNLDPKTKYTRDAAILEQGLRDEPENKRYVFYLAQSYRDAQDLEKAIQNYERRAEMGGWDEEVYYSLFQVAMLKKRTQRDPKSIVDAFLNAYQYRPSRAESLVELAAHYRATHQWALAELFARAALSIPLSPDILFVDASAYAWRALDELAIATYYTQKYGESADLNRRLLSEGKLPKEQRARIEQNLAFCIKNLGG
jgi:glycosyltransferase involved in cell wall biosynthesis